LYNVQCANSVEFEQMFAGIVKTSIMFVCLCVC